MERRHLLLAAMAAAAGLGAAGAAALVASDGPTRVAATAVTVTVARTETAVETTISVPTTAAEPATTTAVQPATTADPAVVVVPPVAGLRLDEATAVLQAAHLQREVRGGGVFGVVDDTAWVVCKSKPRDGERVPADTVVSVQVKRSCPGGEQDRGQGQGQGEG
jgi:PASTA domain